jgi:carbamoyl-phosphate synthase small subunit
MEEKPKKAWLILSNGDIFEGESFGAEGETCGEVVFTTGMTGYLEAMTGSDYYGQILIQTFPMVGNYGVNYEDMQSSRAWIKGYIVREYSQQPSNFRSEKTIEQFMKEQAIVGLCGIDTRQLTRLIRKKGIMNGMITCQDPKLRLKEILADIRKYDITDGLAQVSTKEVKTYLPANTEKPQDCKYQVVAYDFGIKNCQVQSFLNRGCCLTVVPYDTTAQEVLSHNPDGIFLSDGPGDPSANQALLDTIEQLCHSGVPILGIGMGHQLMARANGGQTWKLKHGHRGVNQPVLDYERQKIMITNQNHGYAVINESLDIEVGRITHINVNDKTCEGIRYLAFPGIGVQFQPEPSATTEDTSFVYDDFMLLMERGM